MQQQVEDALREIKGPDHVRDLVTIDAVKRLEIDGSTVKLDLDVVTDDNSAVGMIKREVIRKLLSLDGIEEVELKLEQPESTGHFVTAAPMPAPKTVTQPAPDKLKITWKDGHVSEYDTRELRLACPCASCIDEWTGRPLLDPATVPDRIEPTTLRKVGAYAFQFDWSDAHNTGIYTFVYLRRMG